MPEYVNIIITGTVGLAVWLIQEHRKTRALRSKQSTATEKIVFVLLRDRLVVEHKRIIASWKITTAELQSFREMHQLYIEAGGNGPASHLIEDIERVKLVSD